MRAFSLTTPFNTFLTPQRTTSFSLLNFFSPPVTLFFTSIIFPHHDFPLHTLAPFSAIFPRLSSLPFLFFITSLRKHALEYPHTKESRIKSLYLICSSSCSFPVYFCGLPLPPDRPIHDRLKG